MIVDVKDAYEFFKSCGLSAYGSAAIVANIYAESNMDSENLENIYNSRWKITNKEYVQKVDTTAYNFNDGAGFGLCQWTYRSRKVALQEYAKFVGKSIGDAQMQMEFIMLELKNDYKSLLTKLQNSKDVEMLTKAVMVDYERPADVSEKAIAKRVEIARKVLQQVSDNVIVDYKTERAFEIHVKAGERVTITVIGDL